MLRALFAALLVAPVIAAPVPKEDGAARMRRIYGSPEDPDKDCTFEMVGDKLRIKVPAKHHSMNVSPGLMNAPRVWREVAGDFTAVVRVTFPIRPALGPKPDDYGFDYAAAGILAWVSDVEYARVFREDRPIGGKPREKLCRDLQGPDGSNSCLADFGEPPEKWPDHAYLRLTRDGRKLVAAGSRDGKKWKETDAVEVGGGAVKVGVVAENGYKAPFEVVFDEYTLTGPKK